MFYVPYIDNAIDFEGEDAKSESSSISEKDYEMEWNTITSEQNMNNLKNYVLAGNLCRTHIRSVYWRVLLGVFPVSTSSEWLNCSRASREAYSEIRKTFTSNPYGMSPVPDDNPLSQDENSVWYRYFCDKELKRIIQQDVARTFPENAFFQSSQMQELMVNVLFYYARTHPDMCYRQGMHEILAPILLVFHEDYQTFKLLKHNSVISSFVFEIMDLNYLEEDVYHTFSYVMRHMSRYYQIHNVVPSASGHLLLPNLSNEHINMIHENNESAICGYLQSIRDNHLAMHDRALYNHLRELNIPFTAFGIRWLRLLFGREFPLQALLTLWDAIFAVQSDFTLVGYILIAMLIAIRDKLLSSDYIECLNYLMKYPNTISVKFIINYAIYLKDPMTYRKPNAPTANGLKKEYSAAKNNPDDVRKSYLRNNSMNRASITKKLRNLNPSTRKNTMGPPDSSPPSIDEYSRKNFKMVVSELERTRVLISICKLKLGQYHEILTNYIPTDDLRAQQALTGIQELCSLLDIDHFSLKSSTASDVETAREAGEDTSSSSTENVSLTTMRRATSDAVASYLPPPKSDIDMTIFKQTEFETTDFSRFPAKNPLKLDES